VAAMALDAAGRLWVTTAAYTAGGHDAVYLVGAAGAAPVEVVPGLQTPLGLTWLGDTLYVASTGRIDAFGDLSAGAFATRRTVLAWPAGVGESNNLVQGPDGRLLLGISAPCDHCTLSSDWSASILSLRPDGGDARVFAKRIRAPFGLAQVPGTGELLATMNPRDDLGARTPGDWLAVVREGQDWGFPGCYGQGGAACAGVPAPLAVLDPHAGAGGLAVVRGQLGPATGTAAIVAEWARARVLRVSLARGRAAAATPFLTGLASPLPVLVTGDGALLVGDWRSGVIYRVARG